MDDRVTRIGAIILVALGLGSCQTFATDPLQKARAFVGRGQAQVKTGQYRSARRSLYFARDQLQSPENTKKRETAARRRQKKSLETQINRWIGEAYLDGGQFELARRYLLRALPMLEGADRESVLAELSFLSREIGDRDAATGYRRKLARPYSRGVAGIVDGSSPRMNLAQKKHAS